MRLPVSPVIRWVILMCLAIPALATHQVGGQLEMQAVGDVPGHFKVVVTNYLENNSSGNEITGGRVGIYRKRDDVQMLVFNVNIIGGRTPVVYTNSLCANQRSKDMIVAVYQAEIQLAPSEYNDELGYYMSFQTRNRNNDINNIIDPGRTGFTFYLEFPALQRAGGYYKNSSPHFPAINGEYVCINQPFTYAFGGTDPDGDELRYSMITPLNHKSTNGNGNNNALSAGPYPDINWVSGYSETNSITGNPTLNIDPQTGQLSVTADKLGLYVFAVKVEEYRNGVKIGEVRRDFQFLVIDCPPPIKLDPVANIVSQPTSMTSTTICQGATISLQTNTNSMWVYQWRRDGTNLANATSTTLTVKDSGKYTVLASLSTTCGMSVESNAILLTVIDVSPAIKGSGHLCATDGSVSFSTTAMDNIRFQWYYNYNQMPGQTQDSVRVSQPGVYFVQGTDTKYGCVGNSQSLTITRSAAVSAAISSLAGHNKLCPNDSLALGAGGGVSYIWQKDNGVLPGVTGTSYTTKVIGVFSLTAIDTYGCTGVSPSFTVVSVAPVVVTMTAVSAVCGSAAAAYSLSGSPSGGVFSGSGVTGSQFSPALAGVGDHVLTYGVRPAPECAPTTATQVAVVSPVPTIQMPDTMTTFKGNTFTLQPAMTGNPDWYNWQPPLYLSETSVAAPTVTDIQKDITYALWVKNQYGCEAKDSILIIVVERLWVPDAFTPNRDGVNDVWVLHGIEAFPDAEITIFNRWGEVIYWSQKGYTEPFTGIFQGNELATGPYPYIIKPAPRHPELRGTVSILR